MLATDVQSFKTFIEQTLNKRNLPTDRKLFDLLDNYDQLKKLNSRLHDHFGEHFKTIFVIDTITEISKIYTETLKPITV